MIDACVHHRWASDADVYPYLEPGWREYVGEPNSLPLGLGARRLVPIARYPNPLGEMLPGTAAGSSVEGLRTALFADERIRRALLLFDRATMFAPTHPNPYFA